MCLCRKHSGAPLKEIAACPILFRKLLLVRLPDIPAEQEQDDGTEVICIRRREELPVGLLEQLDTTQWVAELPDEDEEPAVKLRLSPRQEPELREKNCSPNCPASQFRLITAAVRLITPPIAHLNHSDRTSPTHNNQIVTVMQLLYSLGYTRRWSAWQKMQP